MATVRQRKVFDKVMENGGNVSKGMKDAGLSAAYAKNPQKVTESKGWLELLEEQLPDSLLTKVHVEGLKATGHIVEGIGKGYSVAREVPDYSTRHKYLKTALELKGKLMVAPVAGNVINFNLFTQPQFQTVLNKFEGDIKLLLTNRTTDVQAPTQPVETK